MQLSFHCKFPKLISGSAWHYTLKVMGLSEWVCPTNHSIPLFSHSTITDAPLHIGDKTMKITVHAYGVCRGPIILKSFEGAIPINTEPL